MRNLKSKILYPAPDPPLWGGDTLSPHPPPRGLRPLTVPAPFPEILNPPTVTIPNLVARGQIMWTQVGVTKICARWSPPLITGARLTPRTRSSQECYIIPNFVALGQTDFPQKGVPKNCARYRPRPVGM